jgi:hypothetical protein
LFAQKLNLTPCFTPVASPQSNGMSEAFVKCAYQLCQTPKAFNIFRAATDAGCRRVVFASSAQTVEGYSEDRQVS